MILLMPARRGKDDSYMLYFLCRILFGLFSRGFSLSSCSKTGVENNRNKSMIESAIITACVYVVFIAAIVFFVRRDRRK